MIKEKIVQKTVTIKTHCCDVCEKTLKRSLQCEQAICEYCRKELCDGCVEHEVSSDGDYRTVYCKQCWDIAKEYHKKIAELEDEIEVLYDECQLKCKE